MKDKEMGMRFESHMKKHGICMLLVGLVVMANAQWAFMNWAMLIGALITLGGLLKAFMPMTPCK